MAKRWLKQRVTRNDERAASREAQDSTIGRGNAVALIDPNPSKGEEGFVGRKVELQTTIGLCGCVALVVGNTVGSGIFISPTAVLTGSGSIGLTLLVWLVCGFYAFMGSLAFAELRALIPRSGAQYIYLLEGFAASRKRKRLFWGPLIGFLYGWQHNVFARPAAFAVQGLSCAKYLIKTINLDCVPENDFSMKLTAIAIISLISFINCHSARVSTAVITVFTVAKLVALFLIIIGGVAELSQGTSEALSTGFEGTTFNPGGIAMAFYSGLWAYTGWDSLNCVATEIINPEKNILRSLMISCAVITTVYLLVNVAYFVLLSKAEFTNSGAVAVTFATKLLGRNGAIFMMASVTCSIFASALGASFTGIRTIYASAREGHVVDCLAYLHIRHMTPLVSQVFSGCLATLMVLNYSVMSLVLSTGFLEAIFNCLTMVALLILRKQRPAIQRRRAIKVPLLVPVFVIAFSVFMMGVSLGTSSNADYLCALTFLGSGLVVYVPFVYYKRSLPLLDKLNRLVQLVFEVAPPESDQI